MFIDWLPRMLRPFSRNRNWIVRRKAEKASPGPHMAQAEVLEDRTLLSFTWEAAGPQPFLDGAVEGTAATTSPVSGSVTAVVTHPSNPDIMWIGTANGGIWKTLNATAVSPSWTPLTDQQQSLSISTLELDPTDVTNNTLIAGVAQVSDFEFQGGPLIGLLRTTDGGTNWTNITGGGQLSGKSIAGVVARGLNIVVAVNDLSGSPLDQQGIYRSTNGGASFTQISGTNGLPEGTVFDIAADPITPSTLYATVNTGAAGTGIYKSTNTGTNWVLINDAAIGVNVSNPSAVNHMKLAVGRADNVYLGILVDGQLTGMYRSGNGGTSWTALDLPSSNETGGLVLAYFGPQIGIEGYLHFSMAADTTNANIVYLGTDRQPGTFPNSIQADMNSGRLFRINASLAANTQVTALTHAASTVSQSAPHNNSRDMAFDAVGNLIEVNDGGIYRRTNPRLTGDWFSLNGNLQVTEIHSIAYDTVLNRIFGGTASTGVIAQSATDSLAYNADLLGQSTTGDVAVDNVTLAGQGQSIRYSSNESLLGFRRQVINSNGTVQSTSTPTMLVGGIPFRTVDTTIREQNLMILNAVTPTRGIIGTNTIYESFNQFDTLIDLSGPTGTAVTAAAYGGYLNGIANPDVLWYATGDDIYLRSTANSTPVNLQAYPGGAVVDMVLDPHNWQRAYVIDADSVYFTANAGQTWTDVTGTLLGQVSGELQDIAYIDLPGTNDAVAIGAAGGVFTTRTASASSWSELGIGLPNTIASEIVYDVEDDLLVVGTLGRGAWIMRNASITFDPPTQAGTLSFSQDSYRMGDSVLVTLTDLDLAGAGSVIVQITSDSGDLEFLSLTEISGTGVFQGTIATTSAETNGYIANNGLLQLDRGATITATYSDANNGQNQAVTVTDTALVFELSSFYQFDFSNADGTPSTEGFTVTGSNSQWHLSTGLGNLPGHSADDSFYFGQNEGPLGGGSYSNNASGTLTSPLIDLGVIQNSPIFLEFSSFLDLQDGNDTAVVSIIAGNTTIPIASNNGISNLPDSTGGSWQTFSFDVTAYAGQQIRVAFSFTSDGSITGEGWYVDDLVVRAPAGEIHGTKFNDRDGDGNQDFDEPGLAGWTIFTDFNNNGILDDATTTIANTTMAAIPDIGSITSNLTVSGINASIKDLNLQVTIQHTRDSDLTVSLRSPTGTLVQLFSGIGGTTGQNFISTTLDDEALLGIQFGVAPFLGAYIPQQAMSAFDGEDANGTWQLIVTDSTGGNVGNLLNWSLTTTVAEISAVTDANGDYALSGLQAGTYTIAEVAQTGWAQTSPAGTGTHTVTIGTGKLSSGHDFGNWFVNPILTLPSGNALYTENDPPILVDTRATVSDANSPFFLNGVLTVRITQNATFDDVLSIRNIGTGASQVGVNGSIVTYQGVQVGVVSGGTLNQPLTVTFNANASTVAVQAVVRAVSFAVNGDNPSGLTRTLEYELSDNTGGVSAIVPKLVDVLPINDPPVVTVTYGPLQYQEGSGVVPVDPSATVTDPDSADFNGGSVTVTLLGNDTGVVTTETFTTGSLDTPRSTVGGLTSTTAALHDFESGTGFGFNEGYTSSGPLNQWHLTSSLGNAPGHSSGNSFYFGVSETATAPGVIGEDVEGTLYSPGIDLRNVVGPINLSFNYWLDSNIAFGLRTDFVEIGITDSNGVRTVIADNTQTQLGATLNDTGNRWVAYSVDLSQYTGQVVQLDFYYRNDLSGIIQHPTIPGVLVILPDAQGWYLDDIQLTGQAPQASTSTVTVANKLGTITDVNVKLNITHPNVQELTAFLVSPSGTRIRLFSNLGTDSTSNSADFFNTVLDDQALVSLLSSDAESPYTGSFRPEKELSELIGQNPNGQWKLEIIDGTSSQGDNSGTLINWELEISTSAISTNESLSILSQGFGSGQIGVVGNRVTYGGSVFGTISGGVGTTPLHIALSTNSSVPAVQSLLQNIALRIDGTNPLGGVRQVQYVVDDGDGGVSDPAIKTVHVVAVNDAPVLTIPSGTIAFIEGSAAIVLDPFSTVTDQDSADFAGGVLTVSLGNTATANDRVAIKSIGTGVGQVNLLGNVVRVGTVNVGTWSGGVGAGNPLQITFNSNATPAFAQAVIRQLTFQTTGTNPSTTPRQLGLQLTDGDGGTSALQTKVVTITQTNDAPILTLPGPTPINYLAAGTPVIIDPFATVSDADTQIFNNGRLTFQLISGINSRDRLSVIPQGLVTVSGSSVMYAGLTVGRYVQGAAGAAMTIDFNSNASIEAVQAIARTVGFQILGLAPTGETRTVRIQLTDGQGGSSASFTRNITVQINNLPPLNEIPTVPYQAMEDTPVSLSGLTMSDPDAGVLPMTVTLSVLNGKLNISTNVFGGVSAGDITNNGTSQVTLTGDQLALNATLSALNGVVYTPKLDFSGTDRLAMTTNDLGNSGPGGALTDTDTIFIHVTEIADPAGIKTSAGTVIHRKPSSGTFVDPSIQFVNGEGNDVGTMAGAKVLISVATGRNRSDALRLTSQGKGTDQVYVSGSTIKINNITVGKVSGGASGKPLQIVFNANATEQDVQRVLRRVNFRTATQTTVFGLRTIQYQFYDDTAVLTSTATKMLNVTT